MEAGRKCEAEGYGLKAWLRNICVTGSFSLGRCEHTTRFLKGPPINQNMIPPKPAQGTVGLIGPTYMLWVKGLLTVPWMTPKQLRLIVDRHKNIPGP